MEGQYTKNMYKFKILVNGELLDSSRKLMISNPSTNESAGELPLLEPKELIDEAFSAAKSAFQKWKKTPYEKRKALLVNFRNLLNERVDYVAEIMMAEIAKNFNDSKTEVIRTIEYIDQTIEIYEKELQKPLLIGEDVHHIKGKTGIFKQEALGVVLAIAPFNYPVNLLLSKLAPALLIGNTVVFKGATQGSLVTAYLSELFYEAGFPRGTVNCVVGEGRAMGDLLFTNPNIDMIAFTGGTSIGNRIAQLNPRTPLLLELGGKDPALVLDDADLELTVKEIIKGGLSYNGQRCTAIKRVFVTSKLHKQLVDGLNKEINKLSKGEPKQNCFITPLISKKSVDYVVELVQDAVNKGANLQQPIQVSDNLLAPMIVDNVTDDMRLAWEEPFGPVIPIIEYDSLDKAIDLINQSEFGLQASIFSADEEKALEIAADIAAGSVNINRSSSRGPDIFPFSGVKDSGFGIQGIKNALYAMSTIKGYVINK